MVTNFIIAQSNSLIQFLKLSLSPLLTETSDWLIVRGFRQLNILTLFGIAETIIYKPIKIKHNFFYLKFIIMKSSTRALSKKWILVTVISVFIFSACQNPIEPANQEEIVVHKASS